MSATRSDTVELFCMTFPAFSFNLVVLLVNIHHTNNNNKNDKQLTVYKNQTPPLYTDHLLWKDFYGRYMAFHVEHFGTVVTAQQVTPIDTHSTPVFIGVVLFPTRALISSQSPISFGLCPLS